MTDFVTKTRRELSRSLPLRCFPERPPCMSGSLFGFRFWPTYTFLGFWIRFPRHRLIPPERFPTSFLVLVPSVTGGGDFLAIRLTAEFPVARFRFRLRIGGLAKLGWAGGVQFLSGSVPSIQLPNPKASTADPGTAPMYVGFVILLHASYQAGAVPTSVAFWFG